MLYQWHEWQRAWLSPFSTFAHDMAKQWSDEHNPWVHTPFAQRLSADFELLYRLSKEYAKPAFGIHEIMSHGHRVAVLEHTELATSFCRLKRFKRFSDDPKTLDRMKQEPVVLVVAPLSGHHATLLRDTVRALLQDHKVYITDWQDARRVPVSEGEFSLDDYVQTIETFLRHLGADQVHVMAVCQPTVPVLGAVSLMAARGEPVPRSLVLMGGPVDPRQSPTEVNNLATTHSLEWFKQNLIHAVPHNYPGAGRLVYPGFLQLAGFIAMNPGRHITSHWDFYRHLRQGDLEDADAHRKFYNEYCATLDLPARYYLDTIQTVFQEHRLPSGTWQVKGEKVTPSALKTGGLLTLEGELDDISGLGQTRAAHALCTGLPKKNHHHHEAKGVGHYGLFSGRRWREQVYPIVRDFIQTWNT
jgi:poly(3-hydroxybutyrate) depolymerase